MCFVIAAIPVIRHNFLDGLQGGTTNEYYHLTQSQWQWVVSSAAMTDVLLLDDGSSKLLLDDGTSHLLIRQ